MESPKLNPVKSEFEKSLDKVYKLSERFLEAFFRKPVLIQVLLSLTALEVLFGLEVISFYEVSVTRTLIAIAMSLAKFILLATATYELWQSRRRALPLLILGHAAGVGVAIIYGGISIFYIVYSTAAVFILIKTSGDATNPRSGEVAIREERGEA